MSMRRFVLRVVVVFLALMVSAAVFAAPYRGEVFELRQPDGQRVAVTVYGDEFYQRVESLDGYTLIRGDDGWIDYAILDRTGTALVSTGVRYQGKSLQSVSAAAPYNLPPSLEKHIALPGDVIRDHVRQKKAALNRGLAPTASAGIAASAPSAASAVARQGSVRGLTLLIEFPDENAVIPALEIENFCNQVGYSNNQNNGSVRDWFADVSGGLLDYTNHVTAYYMADFPKTYYDSTAESQGIRARELIHEALADLEASGFDFSTLSTDANGNLLALNVFYAGTPDVGWAEGLWPHSWSLWPVFTANNVNIDKYQITNLGFSAADLTIRTFIHENGHMLCGWPDLYDYGYESTGVGDYDIMGYGGDDRNPVTTNGYFRETCGWSTPVDITTVAPGTVLTHLSNSTDSFRYSHPTSSNEFFIIESRTRTGRNAALPDDGLMIWHVDTNGSNDNQQMTETSHYLVSLEQADGRFDLENNINFGDTDDLFDGLVSDAFDDVTLPNANWWNGDASGLTITEITPVAAGSTSVSFMIGDSAGDPSDLDLVVSLDGDENASDNVVRMIIGVENRTGNALDLSSLNVVYYLYEPNLNIDTAVWDTYYCSVTSRVVADVVALATPVTGGPEKADTKIVFSFPLGTTIPSGGNMILSGAFHAANWQFFFDETDDWSRVFEGETDRIVIVRNDTGEVVFGNSPE